MILEYLRKSFIFQKMFGLLFKDQITQVTKQAFLQKMERVRLNHFRTRIEKFIRNIYL
jgi:hypothetical protein